MTTHALLCGLSFSAPHGQTPSGESSGGKFGFAGAEISGGHKQGRNPKPRFLSGVPGFDKSFRREDSVGQFGAGHSDRASSGAGGGPSLLVQGLVDFVRS